MTDFDISDALLRRVTRLELELSRLKDRLAAIEGSFPPPEYDGHMPDPAPIWPVYEIKEKELK
jgi:hypothetical protein